MRLTEVDFGTGTPVTGYGPGFFRVGDAVLEGGALVLPGVAEAWSGFDAIEGILELADALDVLLLGMGADIAHAPEDFRARIEGAGIGLEVMSSPSACRTYNVLLGEGRRVGLAVLPVTEV